MTETTAASFVDLLRTQIRNEFTASQQYVAIAVWFDGADLPRLAARFYSQSVEERNHAMMMVRYMLDRGWEVHVPGIDDVRNEFGDPVEPSNARPCSGQPGTRAMCFPSSSCSGSSRSRSKRWPR